MDRPLTIRGGWADGGAAVRIPPTRTGALTAGFDGHLAGQPGR